MSKFFLAIYDYLSRHKILAAAILVVCVGLSVWLHGEYKEQGHVHTRTVLAARKIKGDRV